MMATQITTLLEPLAAKIGLVLLHSLWQIALITILFVIACAIVRSSHVADLSRKSTRIYRLGCVALGLMAVVPLLTALSHHTPVVGRASAKTTMFPELVEGMVIGSSESRFLELPNPAVTSLMAAPAQESVVKHRLIKRDFAKTKLGKLIEIELRKLDQVGFTGSVLVAHEGQIILATSAGITDQESKNKIVPNALFEIASITKPFTSTAALILADDKKLDLDGSIADYLPNVPDSSRSITVRHLMQHRSGIPGDRYGINNKGLEVAVETMLGDGPAHEPGSRFEYWNQGYVLLSEIIARAAGEPFVDVVRKSIFEPCLMKGTCFNGDELPRDFIATMGTGKLGPPRSCLEHPYGSYGLSYRGTGGIVSNIFDMWKFHHALQSDQLISAESKSASLDAGEGTNRSPYGLGWFVRSLANGDPCISHGGKVRGFNGEFRRYPKTDSCIVVLSNRDDSPSAMVAGLIEGILFPPDPKTVLSEKEAQAFAGNYMSKKGRLLVIESTGGKTAYTLHWGPGNPNAPISRGYVQRDEKQRLVMYQPNDVNEITMTLSENGKQVEEIRYVDLDLHFVRDKNAKAAPAVNREMPDKLTPAEAKKFVGMYKVAVGPVLEIERSQGHLIFAMYWNPNDRSQQVTRGYVMKYKNADYVLYHPSSPLKFDFELSANNKKVVEISAPDANLVFRRDD